MSKGTILLVNDSELVIKYLSAGLRQEGYGVTVARGASEAIVLALQCQFQAAIVGSELPDLNDGELVRLLMMPVLLVISEGHESLQHLEHTLPRVACIAKKSLTLESMNSSLAALIEGRASTITRVRTVVAVSVSKPITQTISQILSSQASHTYDVIPVSTKTDLTLEGLTTNVDLLIIHYKPSDAQLHPLMHSLTAEPKCHGVPTIYVAETTDLDEAIHRFVTQPHSAFVPLPLNPALLFSQIELLCAGREQAQTMNQLQMVLGAFSKELDVSKNLLIKSVEETTVSTRYRQNLLPCIGYKFREPVSDVVAFASALLEEDGLDPKYTRGLEAILSSGRQLLRMTQGIFQLVDMERGTLAVERIRCSTLSIIWKLQDEFQSWLRQSPQRLTIHTEGALPQEINTDPDQVLQNVVHLVHNALRYTVGKVDVRIEYLPAHKALTFTVQDDGPGISANKLPLLFELPWRLEDFGVSASSGLGTGLPFVKYVIEKLRGSIKVSSSESTGTRVQLSIPVGAPRETSSELDQLFASVTAEPVTSESENPVAIDPATLRGKILIAEESNLQRQLYDIYLRPTQVTPSFVSSAEELLTRASEEEFDIVLLNLNSSGLKNSNVMEHLRAITLRCPIIGVTSGLERDSLKRHSDPLCNLVLLRPFERKKFYELMGFYLGAEAGNQPQEAVIVLNEEAVLEAPSSDMLRSLQALPDEVYSDIVQNSPELVPMLLEYLDSLPGQLTELESAITDQDRAAITRLARHLAGDAGLFGYPVLSNTAQALMKLATASAPASRMQKYGAAIREIFERMRKGMSRPPEGISEISVAEPVDEAPLQVSIQELTAVQVEHAQDYFQTFDAEFGKVKTAHTKSDLRRVAFVSNELAGAASMCGIKDLCATLLAIEQACYARDEVRVVAEIARVDLLARQFKRLLSNPSQSTGTTRPTAPLRAPILAEPSGPTPTFAAATIAAVAAATSDLSSKASVAAPSPALRSPASPPPNLMHSPSQGQTQTSTQIIMSDLLDTNPMLRPLIEEFLADVDGYFQKAAYAVEQKSWKELQEVAHEIAGAAGMYGYAQCRQVAKNLQDAAKIQAPENLPQLLRELEQVTLAMRRGGKVLAQQGN